MSKGTFACSNKGGSVRGLVSVGCFFLGGGWDDRGDWVKDLLSLAGSILSSQGCTPF